MTETVRLMSFLMGFQEFLSRFRIRIEIRKAVRYSHSVTRFKSYMLERKYGGRFTGVMQISLKTVHFNPVAGLNGCTVIYRAFCDDDLILVFGQSAGRNLNVVPGKHLL